ncbi:hypothetical protein [Caenimonas koreensis]|uniref:hypothetical protein n=1 Tax=Caenimonas koreensis TaxID=367474 RepID=UPI003784104F
MNIQSISSLFADYSATGGADDADFMAALAAATWQQVTAAHKLATTTSSARTQRISDLHDAGGALDGLQTTKDGTRLLLGADLQTGNALKARLAAIGNTLPTDESYNIALVTTDADGNQVVGAKYLASAAERAAIANGALVGSPGADGVETRTLTSADGKTKTTYQVYTKERMLTASLADVNAVKANMQAQLVVLQKQLDTDLVRLQALGFKAEDFTRQLTNPARKREKQATDNQQAARRDDFNVDAELRRKLMNAVTARETGATKGTTKP